MNLQVKCNWVLPVWLLIWLMAFIVFVDLSVLRAKPITTQVLSLDIQMAGKGATLCQLRLLINNKVVQRSTDAKTCKLVLVDDILILERTSLFDRWLGLYKPDRSKVTGLLLENRVITDVIFIILAISTPLLLRLKASKKLAKTISISFILQVIGLVYYCLLILVK